MKALFKKAVITLATIITLHSYGQEVKFNDTSKLVKPTLFADLGPTCTTPDGMALDKNGNLFLSVLNPTSFEKNGAKIVAFDQNDQPYTWFDKLPLHPISKRVHPMGIDFGPDGNLYVMDNQFFANQLNASRIIRINIKNGKPVSTAILVEGLNFAEAIRWRNNTAYITDALTDNTGRKSAIYSFTLSEMNTSKILLNETNKKDYLISEFTLKPEVTKATIGIDGIAFDKKGDLYAGNFGDGVITKFEFNCNGTVKSKKEIFNSDKLKCCDGFFYDKKRNSIFIANYEENGVYEFNLTTNTITLIWKNDNNDGRDGQLDNPCETIVYKGNLIVVNYDTFIGEKNTEIDSYHTLSKFKL